MECGKIDLKRKEDREQWNMQDQKCEGVETGGECERL